MVENETLELHINYGMQTSSEAQANTFSLGDDLSDWLQTAGVSFKFICGLDNTDFDV